MRRFLIGLGLGAAASGVTYMITQSLPWWWLVGAIVAVLVWFGEWLGDIAD